ncbi:hypothetical protein LY78DRAFT_661049 [Colletotrichum sublineola]|nr:hypothetical protein LY78DRAFT_661049 [Colletotrichum sublineola]
MEITNPANTALNPSTTSIGYQFSEVDSPGHRFSCCAEGNAGYRQVYGPLPLSYPVCDVECRGNYRLSQSQSSVCIGS